MLQGPGIFADLTVTPDAVEGLSADPETDPTASDARYVRQWKLSPYSKLAPDQAPTFADLPHPRQHGPVLPRSEPAS